MKHETESDYGIEIHLETEDVLETIAQAEEFAAAARAFLETS